LFVHMWRFLERWETACMLTLTMLINLTCVNECGPGNICAQADEEASNRAHLTHFGLLPREIKKKKKHNVVNKCSVYL